MRQPKNGEMCKFAVFQVTNRAGLTSLTSSKPFVVDRSPPGTGVVWNSPSNASVSALLITVTVTSNSVTVYRCLCYGVTCIDVSVTVYICLCYGV